MNLDLTFLGEVIGFVLFVGFTLRYVWPPILAAIERREREIAAGLEAAERGRQALVDAEARTAEMMHEARERAARLLDDAAKQVARLLEDGRREAERQRTEALAVTAAQIQQAVVRARDELRGEVGRLVVEAAGRLLEREVRAEDHERLLVEAAQEL
jgi:F-type H+-transporting ATPase subunit b